jgi:hypothetical protein
VLNSPAARSPRGRRAVAAVCVLAVLPLAALAGCAAGANPKPAAAAPRPAAAARQTVAAAPQTVAAAPQAAARVALQFDANVSRAAGPAPAAIAKFRWSALARSPLGYRNSPLLA